MSSVEGFAKSTNRIFHFGSYSYRRQEERRLQEELIRREEELRHKEELFRQQQHELQRHRQEDLMWQVCFFFFLRESLTENPCIFTLQASFLTRMFLLRLTGLAMHASCSQQWEKVIVTGTVM